MAAMSALKMIKIKEDRDFKRPKREKTTWFQEERSTVRKVEEIIPDHDSIDASSAAVVVAE